MHVRAWHARAPGGSPRVPRTWVAALCTVLCAALAALGLAACEGAPPGDLRSPETASSTEVAARDGEGPRGPAGDAIASEPAPETAPEADGAASSLRLSLRPGDLSGSAPPEAKLHATLRGPDGAERGAAAGRAGPSGRFQLWLRDASGRRVRPAPGDRVTLAVDGAEREILVPAFRAEHDLDTQTLRGRGTPGDAIEITLWNPWYPGETESPRTVVGPDGSWSLSPEVGLQPSSHYYVTERLPTGDELFYCYQVPRLIVEAGTSRVLVEALYEVAAAVELLRDGRVVGRGVQSGAWEDEPSRLVLRSPGQGGGSPVVIRAGDVLSATLDGARIGPIEVPALAWAAASTPDALAGVAEPGARVWVGAPAPTGRALDVGADGRFEAPFDALLEPGAAPLAGERVLQLYRLMEGDHVVRLRLGAPRIAIDYDAPLEGSPWRPIRIDVPGGALAWSASPAPSALEGAPGLVERGGRGEPAGDAVARAEVLWPPPAAKSPDWRALEGSEVRAWTLVEGPEGPTAASGLVEETRVQLPPLTIRARADGAGWEGTAPPESLVDLRYWPGPFADADGEPAPARYSVESDAQGRWTLDPRAPGPGEEALDPAAYEGGRVEASLAGPGWTLRARP